MITVSIHKSFPASEKIQKLLRSKDLTLSNCERNFSQTQCSEKIRFFLRRDNSLPSHGIEGVILLQKTLEHDDDIHMISCEISAR